MHFYRIQNEEIPTCRGWQRCLNMSTSKLLKWIKKTIFSIFMGVLLLWSWGKCGVRASYYAVSGKVLWQQKVKLPFNLIIFPLIKPKLANKQQKNTNLNAGCTSCYRTSCRRFFFHGPIPERKKCCKCNKRHYNNFLVLHRKYSHLELLKVNGTQRSLYESPKKWQSCFHLK